MDPITMTALGIGAAGSIGSLISGLTGKNAAQKAAEQQINAYERAAERQRLVGNMANEFAGNRYNEQMSRQQGMMPEYAGQADQLAYNTSLWDTQAGRYQPYYNYGTNALANWDAQQSRYNPYISASQDALNNWQGQQGLYSPYIKAGTNALAKIQTPFNFQADPGYAWRMGEGTKAVERGAAARSGALSGSAVKALDKYSQGLASQEYANAYDRYLKQNQINQNLATQGLGAAGAQNQMYQNLVSQGLGAQNAQNTMYQNLVNQGVNAAGGMGNALAGRGTSLGLNQSNIGQQQGNVNQMGALGAQLSNLYSNNLLSGTGSQYTALAGNAQGEGTINSYNALNQGIQGGINNALLGYYMSGLSGNQGTTQPSAIPNNFMSSYSPYSYNLNPYRGGGAY